jgi:uncharacterized membrane protein HdeD (DUF308 family)
MKEMGGMLELAVELAQRETDIELSLTLPGVIALVAGIAILVLPRILNYIVAAYLILIGVVEIFNLRL